MSMRLFYDTNQDQFVFPSLDAINFEINNVPVSGITGSTGGTLTSLTCPDGSITIGSTAGGYILSNAGANVGSTNLNMRNNAITNVNNLNVGSFNISSSGVLQIQNGNLPVGEIFDSYYNPPTFSDFITNNQTMNFNNATFENVLTATIDNLVVTNQINELSMDTANISNLVVDGSISGSAITNLTNSIIADISGGGGSGGTGIFSDLTVNNTLTCDTFAGSTAGQTIEFVNGLNVGSAGSGTLISGQSISSTNATFETINVSNINFPSSGGNINSFSFVNPNKSVYMFNGFVANENQLPIGGNLESATVYTFDVPLGINFISFDYQFLIKGIDINGTGQSPPFYKCYALYIGNTNNYGALDNSKIEVVQALNMITYNSGADIYVLKGSCYAHIKDVNFFSSLSIYCYDGASLFAGDAGSLVSSVSTSWTGDFYLSGKITTETIYDSAIVPIN
jgi:hypothetical protein